MPGHLAGGRRRGPPPLVDDRVVAPAQERPVEQAGDAAVNPVDEVMRVSPLRWRRTTRDRAALSRNHIARNSPGVNSRLARPTSRTSESPPRTTGMIIASHAIRRIVSGPSSCPPRADPAAHPFLSASRSMVTHRAALVVVGASPPAAAARRQIATNASPRRWSEERRSGQSGAWFGAERGPSIASRTSFPSGSRRRRYSAIPSSSNGWDNDTPCLSWSARRWKSPR